MKILKVVGLVVIFTGIAMGSWLYWQHSLLYPSTNDAYLKANIIQVAPQVNGRVVELNVVAHQKVKKDQLLLKIDPLPYQYALEQAQATYDLAAKQVGVQAAAVVSARSNVMRVEATLTDARSHAKRIQSLADKGMVNKDQAEHANSLYHQAQAAINAANSDLDKAVKALGENSVDNADIRKAAAVLAQAKYDLENTAVLARHSGVLGDVNIRVGNVVGTNQPLFPMVEDHEYWVEANFKETDMQRLKIGQPVNIKLDMYSDVLIKGVIESLSPASGASFSLLPAENATGNWVKVTQRFPVRITVLMDDDLPDLRIGSSASVVVDTTDKADTNTKSQ